MENKSKQWSKQFVSKNYLNSTFTHTWVKFQNFQNPEL